MGMFDEIICDYPLPGNPPAFIKPGHRFQTKDLGCDLTTYTISEDGNFSEPDYTGRIEFYTSNVVGGGPGGCYTNGGEDAASVEYEVIICDGKLVTLIERDQTLGPAFPIAMMHGEPAPRPTDDQIAEWVRYRDQSWIGRKLYFLSRSFGPAPEGYECEVVAEDEHKLCVRGGPHGLQMLYRHDLGNLLFENEAQAKETRRTETEKCDVERAQWKQYRAEWYLAHGLADPDAEKGEISPAGEGARAS